MNSFVFNLNGIETHAINNNTTASSSQRSKCDVMPSIIAKFQNQQGKWITPNCQHIQVDDVHYYGIHKSYQMQTDHNSESILLTRQCYQEMKSHVLQNMNLSVDSKVIQVVGDSASFSEEGTAQAKDFLRSQLQEDSLILYGYTGHAENDGTRCVNAAVSDIILEKNLQDQTVGNLVGFHTPIALKNWGCSGPELQHYVIVYGDDETSREKGTVFGDDVITSDFFADSLLMLDGGAQSFRQACNALLLNQKIIVLSGLRASSKAFAKEESEDKEILTPYFAAAQFLKEVALLLQTNDESNPEMILLDWYRNYFGQGKCYVGDPKRGDFDTKQHLLDDAWNLFIKEKLYLRIQSLVSYK